MPHTSKMDDERIPQLPKIPFLAADGIMVIFAIVIANSGEGPLNPMLFFWVIFCVALGGVFGCLPFYVEYKNKVRLAEYDQHQANLENAERMEDALAGMRQISEVIAEQTERGHRAASAIEGLVSRLDSRLASIEDKEAAEKEKEDPVPAMVENLSSQINGSVASLVRELKAAQSVGQSELRELLAKSNVELRESIDKVAAFAENQVATDITAELSALGSRLDSIVETLSQPPAEHPGNVEIVDLSEDSTEEPEEEAAEEAPETEEETEPVDEAEPEPEAMEEEDAELEDAEYNEAVAEEFPVGDNAEEEEPEAEEAPEETEPEDTAEDSEDAIVEDELEDEDTEDEEDESDDVSFLSPEDEAELEDEDDEEEDETSEPEDASSEEEPVAEEPAEEEPEKEQEDESEETAEPEPEPEEAEPEPVAEEEPEEEDASHDQPDLLDDIPEGSAKAKRAGRKETSLVAQVLIGIGNKPYVRGTGPGLSEDEGVPMEFLEIGKWQWVAPDASEPVTITIYKNDQVPAEGDPITLEPGQKRVVTPRFAG